MINTTVGEVMTCQVMAAREEADFKEIVAVMRHGHVSALPVPDSDAFEVLVKCGIVTITGRAESKFLRFLKLIDVAVPGDLDLHLILDNYATHKTPVIHQWLTPASERFRKITGHGVIPAPSGAGALLLHAEDGLDCLLVLGVFRPADKAQLTAIVTFEGCLQSVFGYPGVSKKRPAYRQIDVCL